jgi:hypothetical protein
MLGMLFISFWGTCLVSTNAYAVPLSYACALLGLLGLGAGPIVLKGGKIWARPIAILGYIFYLGSDFGLLSLAGALFTQPSLLSQRALGEICFTAAELELSWATWLSSTAAGGRAHNSLSLQTGSLHCVL